jgi:hypothetical protein
MLRTAPPWIAEDVLDAFFLEAADDDFGTRQLHGKSFA